MLLGLVRKLRIRAKDLPRTMLASGGGGLLALWGMWLFEATFGHLYGGQLASQKQIALQIAVLYGLASPFLAPFQLGRPVITGLLALAAYYWAFFYGPVGNLGFMAAIVFLILSSSSLAEFLFQLTRGLPPQARQVLRWIGLPLRMAISWVFMFAVLCATHPQVWFRSLPLHRAQYLELALWAVLAVFAGGTAMETGKEEMKKCLPEHQKH